LVRAESVRGETSSSGELNQAITRNEWKRTEGNRVGCKPDIFELVATLECPTADSFEFFVADDALERGAAGERTLSNNFMPIREGNALEGGTLLECVLADSLKVFVPDDALEGGAFEEYQLFDDFEVIGESDTREGEASSECLRS